MKIKKFIASAATLTLLAPSLAFAAYNDVSLTTDANISLTVSGTTVNLDVSGSTASVESVTVSENTLTVVLNNPSTITISSSNRYNLSVDNATLISDTTCTATESTVSLASTNSSGAQTANITVGNLDVCNSGAGTGGGGGGGDGGDGGGGGGGGGSAPRTTTPTTAATPVAPSVPSAPASNAALIESLKAQLNALLAKIAAMTGTSMSATGASMPVGGGTFARDLQVGSTGEDVRALQQYLNSHGYTVAESGPGSAGSETTMYGNATKAAVIKLQTAAGISPAVGYFGPKTRAYVNANP